MTDEIEKFLKKMQEHLPSKVGDACVEHLGVNVNQKGDGSTEFCQKTKIEEYCVNQKGNGSTEFCQKTKIEEYCAQFEVSNESKKIRTMNFN